MTCKIEFSGFQPLDQLHPEWCTIKTGVLHNLDWSCDFGVSVLVLLAIRLHGSQRVLKRLASCGRITILQVFVVTKYQT